jgi:phosphate transport system permease protein
MVDSVVSPTTDSGRMGRHRLEDAAFRGTTKLFALGVLLLLGAVMVALFIGGLPAMRAFGFGFLVDQTWNPVKQIFGGAPAIYGTLLTSFIAMLIGVPLALGVAIFLTELCPPVLRRPIGVLIELLAAIPSIIYGIWGLFILAPFLQLTVQPFLKETLGNIPPASSWR